RGPGLRTFIVYLPTLLWAATLLWIGSLTGVQQPAIGIPLDKAAHFAMYGVLGALGALGWLRAGRVPAPVFVVLFAIAIGAADELHQGSIPERSAEVADWVMDIAGAIAGFAFAAHYGRIQLQRTGHPSHDIRSA